MAERCTRCGRFFRMADPDGRCDSCRRDAYYEQRAVERHKQEMALLDMRIAEVLRERPRTETT